MLVGAMNLCPCEALRGNRADLQC
ncbi:hypothetical protein ACFLWG_02510 [Chloroflexota bacterium]